MIEHDHDKAKPRSMTTIRSESIAELIATCRAEVVESCWKEHVVKHKTGAIRGERAQFVGRGFSGQRAAYQAANETWSEGLAILDRMESRLADVDLPAPVSRRRKLRWDESDGDEFDRERLQSGQAAWRQTRRQNTRGPATITVVVNCASNASVRSEDILWRGAAALVLSEKLERVGYRVELWGMYSVERAYTSAREGDVRIATRLKAAGDPIDRATIVNAVSGWFFRTVGFSAICAGAEYREISHSLGRSIPLRPEDVSAVSADESTVVVDNCKSLDDACDLVRNTMAKLNERAG